VEGGSGWLRVAAAALATPAEAEFGGATLTGTLPLAVPALATALDAPGSTPLPLVPPAVRAFDATEPPPTNTPAPVPMIEPVARAPLAIAATVPAKSPPVRVGDPPSTAEKSLGICQQSIIKMTAAPITSKAVIKGRADALTLCASSIQFSPRFIPAAMRQYSR